MSKNVAAIKALYDDAFNKLQIQMRTIIEHGEMSSPAEDSLRAQVRWIYDLGKTMILVNQIESARKKPEPQQPQTNAQGQAIQQNTATQNHQTPQQRLRSPTEEIKIPPPTKPTNQKEPPPNNLGNIPSPGGWSN